MLPKAQIIATRLGQIALTISTVALLAAPMSLPAESRSPDISAHASIPIVRAASPRAVGAQSIGTSGTIRARTEAPLAFQVGGRIAQRSVDAGLHVSKGTSLMRLDPQDLVNAVQAAEAEYAAANAAVATAEADLTRNRRLGSQDFISPQAVERAELVVRESQARRNAAAARLSQARNAQGYANLTAPTDGVLIDVTGEPGQVVASGQAVAVLAHGPREVEVFFPEHVTPPSTGVATLANGRELPLELREAAGSVDPLGRTLRARYAIAAEIDGLVLGSVLRTRFELPDAAQQTGADLFELPISALDERGQGAQVWRILDGKVQAVTVLVQSMDDAHIRITGPLSPDDRIIALGTHLMHEGMAVRERSE